MGFLLPDIANAVRLRWIAVRVPAVRVLADTPTVAIDLVEAGLLR